MDAFKTELATLNGIRWSTTSEMNIPTIEQITEATGMEPSRWEGNCYAIASTLLKHHLVEGRLVYGHYFGPVDQNGYWGWRGAQPFYRHGWVELKDGRICDPTRWSFENVEPYVWVSENDKGEYDEGGNLLRQLSRKPYPETNPDDKKYTFTLLYSVIGELFEVGAVLDEAVSPEYYDADPLDVDFFELQLTATEIAWIAGISLRQISDWSIRDIYIQIVEHGLGAFIPIDNRRLILGE